MSDLHKVCVCVAWNLRMMLKNLRFYMGLLLGFLICFFLTEKIITYAGTYGTDLQMFEPFIWSYADGDSVLFASLALLLPLSQIPRLDAAASYLIFRTGRNQWVIGQVITTIVVSIFYTVFLLVATGLLTLGRSFVQNRWSDTATILSFAQDQFDVALMVIRRTVKQTDPYSCVISIMLLMTQYMLFLSLCNLWISLHFGKKAGMTAMIIVSLYSYILTPNHFMLWMGLNENMQYIANLWAAWLSPLQHATYTMHSFGYNSLPSFLQTHILMGSASLILIILSILASKKIQFRFTKGESHG